MVNDLVIQREDVFRNMESIGLVFSVEPDRLDRLDIRNSGGWLLCSLWKDGVMGLRDALTELLEQMV